MATNAKLIKTSNGEVIVPKTRSNWITRTNNSNYEDTLNPITSQIKSGIIYDCTHSKSGTVHNITNLTTELPSVYTIRFKANGDYTDGDTFLIHNTTYTVGSFANEDNKITSFKNGAITECDIDSSNHIVYLKSRMPLVIPYNPKDPPQFTYTGTHEIVDDGELGWRIKFTSSGTFILNFPETLDIDGFLVGGGGTGGISVGNHSQAGGFSAGTGGGGGYTKTLSKISLINNTSYIFTVGAGGDTAGSSADSQDGGNTVALDTTVNGGKGGQCGRFNDSAAGGAGGSGGGGTGYGSGNTSGCYGGDGGSDGFNGAQGAYKNLLFSPGGVGQGTTTREFGESTGTLYSGGGGGAQSIYGGNRIWGKGGAGGGGDGGHNNSSTVEEAGYPATFYGGGGGGGLAEASIYDPTPGVGGTGFQGIVIIRNTRSA